MIVAMVQEDGAYAGSREKPVGAEAHRRSQARRSHHWGGLPQVAVRGADCGAETRQPASCTRTLRWPIYSGDTVTFSYSAEATGRYVLEDRRSPTSPPPPPGGTASTPT